MIGKHAIVTWSCQEQRDRGVCVFGGGRMAMLCERVMRAYRCGHRKWGQLQNGLPTERKVTGIKNTRVRGEAQTQFNVFCYWVQRVRIKAKAVKTWYAWPLKIFLHKNTWSLFQSRVLHLLLSLCRLLFKARQQTIILRLCKMIADFFTNWNICLEHFNNHLFIV